MSSILAAFQWHKALIYWGIALLLIASSAITIGDLAWQEVWEGAWLRLTGQSSDWNALLDERLPRMLLLTISGSALAISGAVMQALFQTPLASASLLGSNLGGSLGMLCIIILGWHLHFPEALATAAIAGSLMALTLVYLLWKRTGQAIASLIMIGLSTTALLGAIESSLLYSLRHDWQLVQLLSELHTGSPILLGWNQLYLLLPPTIIGQLGCLYYWRELDLLCLGDEEAATLGVNVSQIRWRLFLCVTMLSGSTLATVGDIAFFGMLLPCSLRYLHGPSHYLLLPACSLGGSSILLAIDAGLRFLGSEIVNISHLSGVMGSGVLLAFCVKNRSKW